LIGIDLRKKEQPESRTDRSMNHRFYLQGMHAPKVSPMAFEDVAWAPAEPTEVFDTYWRFAAERQAIFFRKAMMLPPKWTDDATLQKHKFTNAYRAADRVSQFLIRQVIYQGNQEPEELLFRIILFKLFNRTETWNLLKDSIGSITWKHYEFASYEKTLSAALAEGIPIYSGAYMMPSGLREFGSPRKHINHLHLLESMMRNGLPRQIQHAKSMREAFQLLRSYPTIGDFLAYQMVTDLNYSTLTDFSEMEFVVPGPGARDGIRKCFRTLGGLKESEIIILVAQRQRDEFSRCRIDFQSLWGRQLQLIDCQNLFCEVDKYARSVHPEIHGVSARTRIKQRYRAKSDVIDYWFPPKWNLNDAVQEWKQRTGVATKIGLLASQPHKQLLQDGSSCELLNFEPLQP
jgi:hypothetical protein